jgi:lysophospholipase L1-like esterase
MGILPIVCLTVLAIPGAFAAAELAARWFVRRFGRYYVWAPYSRMRMELDPDVLPNLGREARFEVNADGERGDPLPHDRSSVYRVLVAGGSATECYYVDQESTWPLVLQSTLGEPHHLKELGAERVHVGNVARSLAASRQLCRIFERVLPCYERLDAIVLLVGASDVIRWLEHRAPAVPDDADIPASQLFAVHPEGPFGWSPRTLALRRIASRVYHRIFRPVAVRQRVGKRLAHCREMRARATHILDTVPSPMAMLDRYETNLRRLIQLSRAKSQRVIVVRQPWFDKTYTPEEEKLMWSFAAGSPHAGEVTDYYAHTLVWRLLRQVNARTSSVCRQLGVEHVDLMNTLDRDVKTYYDELHHTPKGCAVIGRAIAEAILHGVREPELEEVETGTAVVARARMLETKKSSIAAAS